MPCSPPEDQELVVHVFAPLRGPSVQRAYDRVRTIVDGCREQLRLTEPLSGTGLPTALPPQPPTLGDGLLAGIQDRAADLQAIVRREHDVLVFSMVFATPLDTPERRLRIGSAAPNGWVEFHRWWSQLAGEPSWPLLGVVLIDQAKHPAPRDGGAALATTAPHHVGDAPGWPLRPPLARGGFAVWESTGAGDRADRRLVALASPEKDAQLSAWTWSDGSQRMPALGRYLMHAAKLRFQSRVLGEGEALAELRERAEERMGRLQELLRTGPSGTAEEREELDELRAEEAALLRTIRELRTMARTVEIVVANMNRSLPDPLPHDAALAGLLPDRIADELAFTDTVRANAEGMRALFADRVPPHPLPERDREPAAPVHDRPPPAAGDNEARLLFSVDAIGYSSRRASQKEDVQERIAAVARTVLGTIGLALSDTDHQGTGDGLNVALPADQPIERVLPMLMEGWRTGLERDNERFRDRLRLRFAATFGLFARGAIGFTGDTIIEVARLVDCQPLRDLAVAHPDQDMVVALSDGLYKLAVRPGFPDLDRDLFRAVDVTQKEYRETAWLYEGWLPDSGGSARRQL